MKNLLKRLVGGVGVIIFCIVLLSGCGPSIHATKSTGIASNAVLLIMPPRDVVQGGAPHIVGKGSGRLLQRAIQRELNRLSNYDVVLFEANDEFNHTAEIKRKDAILESIKMGADYCLILTFGEFRNAAPMTFRSDFVSLDRGFLVDVNTSQVVWSLNSPFMLVKGNIGNHYGLIDDIAVAVAGSIVRR